LIQIVLFGLTHIKGLDVWGCVDLASVMILGTAFVYVAYKTRTLVAGIVFHFLHDSLLYVVQVPGGEYFGLRENLAFFLALWVMVGVACLAARVAAERLGVQSEAELYEVGPMQVGESVV
jgi:membrane protease YdiL (CAAX protease family)